MKICQKRQVENFILIYIIGCMCFVHKSVHKHLSLATLMLLTKDFTRSLYVLGKSVATCNEDTSVLQLSFASNNQNVQSDAGPKLSFSYPTMKKILIQLLHLLSDLPLPFPLLLAVIPVPFQLSG